MPPARLEEEPVNRSAPALGSSSAQAAGSDDEATVEVQVASAAERCEPCGYNGVLEIFWDPGEKTWWLVHPDDGDRRLARDEHRVVVSRE